MSVPVSAIQLLADELEPLAPRERSALKREFMEGYGLSSSTLSRRLRAIGVRSHNRSDGKARRKVVKEEDLLIVAAIQRRSQSLRKGTVMPAEEAIEIAEDSGLIEPGVISSDYYNDWLRKQDASRKQQSKPEPHVRLRSLGPNHVHQFDFSLAVNWKMFEGQPVYQHLVYKNKPPTGNGPRLWRAILTDHATGAYFPYYIATTGESQAATIEALYHAWAAKTLRGEDVTARYPFRGVPRILMLDRGPGNRSQVTTGLMERLGVKVNICEGARSKGQVEAAHSMWESTFESRFRWEPPQSVEQLNEWALDFAVARNSNKTHTRTGASRSELWAWHINSRRETRLRELRVGFEEFKAIALTDPKRCLVYGDRTVRFKSKRYRLPEEFAVDSIVMVQYSPFFYPWINVKAADQPDAETRRCGPIELNEFNFDVTSPVVGEEYQSHKHTRTKRFISEADERAKQIAAQADLKVFGHHAEKAGEVQALKDGEALEIEGIELEGVELTYTPMQARDELMERLGRELSRPESNYTAEVFGDKVTDGEIDTAISAIEQGVEAKVLVFNSGEKP